VLTFHRRFTNAGVNIVTDILVAILPLPFLNQLQLPKRQRIALMVVFALGGFTCIISILRLQSLLVFLHNSDISWHNPLAAIWSSLEVNIGILCSCLPTLKAMVSRYFPRAFNSSYLRGSDHSQERARMENGGVRKWRWTWGDRAQTDATSSSSPYYGSSGSSGKQETDKFSFDALGRGPGRDASSHKTTVRCEPGVWGRGRVGDYGDDGGEELEMGERGTEGREESHGIQVVTVVEQEVEKGYAPYHGGNGRDGKSEAGSERELVNVQTRRGGECRHG
jgi:hypothetical protein